MNLLMMLYLAAAAYIDHKTKSVYRIGSILFILLAILNFSFTGGIENYERMERLLCIVLFALIVFVQGKWQLMGWGDVFTYIGVFFWIGSWEYECMTMELLAVYMLLANILFVVFHIRKFDWKKKKLREEAAFLPAMAGAMMVLGFLRIYFQLV